MAPQLSLHGLDPHQPLTGLTVGAFAELLSRWNLKCVDFSTVPVGPVPLPVFPLTGFKFIVNPEGRIADVGLPSQPIQRYLQLAGTGQILVELPQPATLIDVLVANQGGAALQLDFFTEAGINVGPTLQKPPGPVQRFTCEAHDLRYVRVKVDSAECLIWKVCYVPQ